MAPKKASKPSKPQGQPVPEQRGYEFGGPYVLLLYLDECESLN